MDDAPPPELDPETLERLRRSFALRLDRLGNFHFEGDPLTHPRVVRYLRRCLDTGDTGEPIVALAGQWTYLRVDDLPLRVLRVRGGGEREPRLVLDDEREVVLSAPTLVEEAEGGLRCEVPARASGRPIGARFTNTAAMDLDAWLEWPRQQVRPNLVVGDERFLIPLKEPPTPNDPARPKP